MPPPPTPIVLCEVCRETPKKYTCPACGIKYCSVACSKKHKETCTTQSKEKQQDQQQSQSLQLEQPLSAPSPTEAPTTASTSSSTTADAPDSVLQLYKDFDKVKDNPELMDMLSDPRLQSLITRIDTSADREAELERHIKANVHFSDFVGRLVQTVQPQLSLKVPQTASSEIITKH